VITAARHSPRVRLAARLALLLAGLGLGTALIVFLLRSANLNQLGSDFSHAEYGYLVPALVAFAANLLLKLPRWKLLYGDDAPDWDTMFGAINVGYAVNTLLPARLGDLVRAYWVRDRTSLSMVRTLSTIALERVLDGLAVFVMFLVIAPTVAFPATLRRSAVAAGTLFVVVLLAMVVLAFLATRENWFSRRLARLETGRWGLISRLVRLATAGLQALRSWRVLALVALYTAIIWLANAVLLWLVARAFHIDVSLAAGALGNAAVSLGMVVPSTPGYIGVFDYLIVMTLGLYGVHRTPALAAAFVFHAIAFIPVTIIGIVYIARSGLQSTLRLLRKDVETAADLGSPAGLA